MKELLEKIVDQLYYLCPGVVLLGSVGLWISAGRSPLWEHESLLVGVAFVLAYVFAWVLVVSCRLIQIRFVESAMRVREGRSYQLALIGFGLTQDLLKITVRIVESLPVGSIQMQRQIILGPAEWLAMCHALPGLESGSSSSPVEEVGTERRRDKALREAEQFQSDFTVNMSLALAMLLVSLQSIIRFILHFVAIAVPKLGLASWEMSLGIRSPAFLLALALLGIWSFARLRTFAIRAWLLGSYMLVRVMLPTKAESLLRS